MGSSANAFSAGIDKAFSSQPNVELNADTMMDANKYKQSFKEDDEVDENLIATDINEDGEATEATGSGSVGGYSAPVFGGDDEFWKKSRGEMKETDITEACWKGYKQVGLKNKNGKKVPNCVPIKEETEKVEATEATTSGSVGQYSSPSMWAKSTNKKDWGTKRKTQVPGGSFVSVKKKCKKFPYCNQGDIKALNIYKNESVKEAIKSVSDKLNLSETIIKAILEYEYEKISKRTK